MPYTNIPALVVSGTNLFAGTYGGGVWRSSLSEMVTGVKDVAGNGVPERFELAQNYPNPFNRSTTIQFSLPRAAHVDLRVFNMLGEEIATLLSEELGAGNHTKQWNAANIASGVYFYRIQARPINGGQAGSFTQTKKLVLLK
jgi:hypothetical protein